MSLWSDLDALRARYDLLTHPFYERWSAGELSRAELAGYAGQYRHAVVALAHAAAAAAASLDSPADDQALCAHLQEHAREEAEHVALWDEFGCALGCDGPQPANAETIICARTWAGDGERPLLSSLMALHTIEVGQPAIAAVKRVGLIEHYDVPEGPATSYFDLHEHRDIEHAADSRALIQRALDDPGSHVEGDCLLAEAEAVLRGNWLLLDGVERSARLLAA